MADEVTPSGGGMPKTFGSKTSFMLGPLVLFLIIGVGISFAILWVMAGKMEEKLKAEADRAAAAELALTTKLDTTSKLLAEETKKAEDLKKQVVKLEKEKDALAEGLKSAIGNLETVSSSLQATSKALDEFQKATTPKVEAHTLAIADNTKQIEYLKKDVNERFEKISTEIGQMKKVDVLLKNEYLALRTDVNQTMERGNVTEAELNKLSDRSKIFQLRVLTARAKEAEEAAREGDLKRLLVKLSEQ